MEANEHPAPGTTDQAAVSTQSAPADTGVPSEAQAPETRDASSMAAGQTVPNQTAPQAPAVDPAASAQTMDAAQQAPQGQVYTQPQQAQPAGQTVVTDPATGQLYLAPPQGLVHLQPVQGIPDGPPPQYAGSSQQQIYTQVPPTEAPKATDYTQVIKSVEAFAEGDATVADVVKTLYAETAQDDQFWKGAIVGVAATVLLTNDTVRGAMGKTLAGLFGAATGATAAEDKDPAKGDDAKDPASKANTDQDAANTPKGETANEETTK